MQAFDYFNKKMYNILMAKISIDETGNLGEGGGDYFVIAASVFETIESQKRAAKLIRKTQKRRFKFIRKELKFSDMDFDERQEILTEIAQLEGVKFYFIAIYKPNSAIIRKIHKNLAYNYFSGMLMDRIVSDYNEDMKVTFDQRATSIGSQNSLLEYITIRAATNPNFDKNIFVTQKDSRISKRLQFADIIAGTIGHYYKHNGNRELISIIEPQIVKCHCEEYPRANFGVSFLDQSDCNKK